MTTAADRAASAAGTAPSSTTERRARRPDPSRRGAWLAWGLGVGVYFVATFHRSSLGVAGVLAAQRFGVGSTALATFAMVQLLVYAGMQIPVGLLVDRFGPRRLLATGLVVMGLGQGLFAFAHALGPALLARGLLGCGDAMIFVSVLRLVAAWFPPRRNALIVQLTALVGQTGSILSTFPLSFALHRFGWMPTFAVAAAVTLLLTLVVLGRLRDSPDAGRSSLLPRALLPRPRHPAVAAPAAGARGGDAVPLRRSLLEAWRSPFTRVGIAVHFTTQFPSTIFGMLWGYPFLVAGEGLSPATASAMLTVLVLAAMVHGQVLGQVVARCPQWRLKIALGVIGATAVCWSAILLWPGQVPLGVLVALEFVIASGGPASMIGFDLARSGNPVQRLGTATGMVNVGGFVASVICLLAVGAILDRLAPGGPAHYTLGAFRVALAFQLVLQALGVVAILRLRRRLPHPGGGRAWRGQWLRWTAARSAAEGTAAAPVR